MRRCLLEHRSGHGRRCLRRDDNQGRRRWCLFLGVSCSLGAVDALVQWCNGALVQWCSGAFQAAVHVRCAVDVLAQWCNGALVQWCNGTFQIAVRVRCAVDALVQCCFGAYVGALMQWFVCLSVWRSVALSVCLSESLPIPLVCHLPLEMANPRTLDRRWWVNNVY